MSDVDRNVVEGFRELRRFCRQVQLLLSAADGLMNDSGWATAGPNVATAELSQSLAKPDNWLPQYFFRFYTNESMPRILAFVSVIFEDLHNPELVTEAFASAGWFEYVKDVPASSAWEYWYAKTHIWVRDRDCSGKLCFTTVAEWRKFLGDSVSTIATFAYPLSAIVDEEALRRLITNRLQDELSTRNKAAQPT